uniref:Uncharacterized protein n=1 Tax=Cacopsylla melanoneura TaxID=428564 RepID=A0A8D9ETY3_9HEMI
MRDNMREKRIEDLVAETEGVVERIETGTNQQIQLTQIKRKILVKAVTQGTKKKFLKLVILVKDRSIANRKPRQLKANQTDVKVAKLLMKTTGANQLTVILELKTGTNQLIVILELNMKATILKEVGNIVATRSRRLNLTR